MFDIGLVEVEEALRTITVALDPDTVPAPWRRTAMERFARIEKMAHAGARLMGERVADSGAWKNRGHQSPPTRSPTRWVARGEAQRELGTADKLAKGLDATDQAARRGELCRRPRPATSPTTAAVDPAAEQDLLDLARGAASAGELREEATPTTSHAATSDNVERHRRIRRNRSLRLWSDDDGGARLSSSRVPSWAPRSAPSSTRTSRTSSELPARPVSVSARDAYAADAFVDTLRDAAAYRRGESVHDASDDTEDDAPADSAAASRSPGDGATGGSRTTTNRSTSRTGS